MSRNSLLTVSMARETPLNSTNSSARFRLTGFSSRYSIHSWNTARIGTSRLPPTLMRQTDSAPRMLRAVAAASSGTIRALMTTPSE